MPGNATGGPYLDDVREAAGARGLCLGCNDNGLRSAYLALRVEGVVPPPRPAYEPTYTSYDLDFRGAFPRLADGAEVTVDAFYLDAPIVGDLGPVGQVFNRLRGSMHSGVGLLVRDARGGRELFRLALEYWACLYNSTMKPVLDRDGELLTMDGRMEWRARAMVTAAKTHRQWHPDWKRSQLLGRLGGADAYRQVLDSAERWGRTHTRFQRDSLYFRGTRVLPAMNCNTFTREVLSTAIGEDLYALRRIDVEVTQFEINLDAYREVSAGKELDAVTSPHCSVPEQVSAALGAMNMSSSNLSAWINHTVTSPESFRFYWRAARNETWTWPRWYDRDRQAIEVDDFPDAYVEGVVDRIHEILWKGGRRKETTWVPWHVYLMFQTASRRLVFTYLQPLVTVFPIESQVAQLLDGVQAGDPVAVARSLEEIAAAVRNAPLSQVIANISNITEARPLLQPLTEVLRIEGQVAQLLDDIQAGDLVAAARSLEEIAAAGRDVILPQLIANISKSMALLTGSEASFLPKLRSGAVARPLGPPSRVPARRRGLSSSS